MHWEPQNLTAWLHYECLIFFIGWPIIYKFIAIWSTGQTRDYPTFGMFQISMQDNFALDDFGHRMVFLLGDLLVDPLKLVINL